MLKSLQQLLVDPFKPMPSDQAMHIRNIAGLLFGLIIFIVFANLVFWITAYPFTSLDLIASVLATCLVTGFYLLARMGRTQLALWLTLITLSLSVLSLLSIESETDDNVLALLFLVVPIAISSAFMSTVAHTIYWVTLVGAILITPLLLDTVDYGATFSGPVTVIVGIGFTSTIVNYIVSQTIQRERTINTNLGQRLDILMHFTPTISLLVQDGIIRQASPAAAKFFGTPSEETLNDQPLETYLPVSEQSFVSAHRVKYGNTYALRTHETVIVQGKEQSVHITNVPIVYKQRIASQLLIQVNATQYSDHKWQTLNTLMQDFAYEFVGLRPDKLRLANLYGGFQQITGYAEEEAESIIRDVQIFHPADRHLIKHQLRMALEGETRTVEARIITKDNQTRWLENDLRPLYQNKRISGVIGYSRDITEQVTQGIKLKQYNVQQAIVAELGQRALRQPEDLKGFIDEALMLCSHLLEVNYGAVHEYADGVVTRFTAIGWGDQKPQHTEDTNSPVQHALKKNHRVFIKDIHENTEYSSTAYPKSIRSVAILVLQGQGRAMGALELCGNNPRNYDAEEINFLQSVANIIAAFIEKRRVDFAEREQRAISQAISEITSVLTSTLGLRDVLDKLLENLSRIVPHDAASVMVIKDELAQIVSHRGFKDDENMTTTLETQRFHISSNQFLKQLAYNREGVVISDVTKVEGWHTVSGIEWIRGYIGVPIVFQDRLIGIINVDSREVDAFSQEDLNRLQTLASQASIAIRNAEYTDELEQRVAERTRELQIERHSLQTVLDSTGEGIAYVEGDVIRYANDILTQMTGYASEQLIDMHIQQLLHALPTPDDTPQLEFWQGVTQHIQQQPIWRSEALVQCSNGEHFDAGLTVSLIDSIEDHSRTVILIRDISEAKALEAQKARFIANASHELRSPITNLNTRLYLMKRAPEKMPDHLAILEQVIERMNQLVEDLLDTSRFEHGVIQMRPRSVVLQNIIHKVVTIQQSDAEEKGVTLLHEFDDEPMQVHADPNRLEQVLTNLINNAINYTENGGTVRVKSHPQTEDDTHYALIAISDTGMGIPAEDLENIFQPFYRGKTGVRGTGLGLSITREIIHQHNGKITVSSQPQEGSTFHVYLPLNRSDS